MITHNYHQKYYVISIARTSLEKTKEALEKEGIELYSIKEFFETHVKPVIEDQVGDRRKFPDPLLVAKHVICTQS